MIAIESFRKFHAIDIYFIVVLASFYLLLSFLSNAFLSPQFSYVVSLLAFTFLMALTVHLIRKAGSATLYGVFSGLFTLAIPDIGPVGETKFLVFLFAGLLFELFFVLLKLEFRNAQIDIIAGAGMAAAAVPLFTGLLLSFPVVTANVSEMVNLMGLSLLTGTLGGLLSFGAWYKLRTVKSVLQFQYETLW